MFFKIDVLKNFTNFTESYLCWSLFLIKLRNRKFIKKRIQRRCFSVTFAKFLKSICLYHNSLTLNFITFAAKEKQNVFFVPALKIFEQCYCKVLFQKLNIKDFGHSELDEDTVTGKPTSVNLFLVAISVYRNYLNVHQGSHLIFYLYFRRGAHWRSGEMGLGGLWQIAKVQCLYHRLHLRLLA